MRGRGVAGGDPKRVLQLQQERHPGLRLSLGVVLVHDHTTFWFPGPGAAAVTGMADAVTGADAAASEDVLGTGVGVASRVAAHEARTTPAARTARERPITG